MLRLFGLKKNVDGLNKRHAIRDTREGAEGRGQADLRAAACRGSSRCTVGAPAARFPARRIFLQSEQFNPLGSTGQLLAGTPKA